MVVWLSLPLTLRELSKRSASDFSVVSASLRALRPPPYFLSEKYLVKVVPVRLRHSLQPWNAVVSYVKRVRFFFDFIVVVCGF